MLLGGQCPPGPQTLAFGRCPGVCRAELQTSPRLRRPHSRPSKARVVSVAAAPSGYLFPGDPGQTQDPSPQSGQLHVGCVEGSLELGRSPGWSRHQVLVCCALLGHVPQPLCVSLHPISQGQLECHMASVGGGALSLRVAGVLPMPSQVSRALHSLQILSSVRWMQTAPYHLQVCRQHARGLSIRHASNPAVPESPEGSCPSHASPGCDRDLNLGPFHCP